MLWRCSRPACLRPSNRSGRGKTPLPLFAILGLRDLPGSEAVQITCPKCSVTIEADINDVHLDHFRWGTSHIAQVESACQEWKDAAHTKRAGMDCGILRDAIIARVAPRVLGGGSP